jgi:hypothetical protein
MVREFKVLKSYRNIFWAYIPSPFDPPTAFKIPSESTNAVNAYLAHDGSCNEVRSEKEKSVLMR